MDNRLLKHNYSLLVPLLTGFISVIGICLILVSAWFPRQNTPVVPTKTVTPFKYLLLATETVVPTPGFETAAPTEIFPTPTSEVDVVLTPALTEQNGISTDDFFTPTATITPDPIFAESDPMRVGIYDDRDSEIIRIGNWNTQQNVENAHQKTLLVSNTVGNYIAFSFIGQEMALGYQSSNNAGDMLINIDGSEVTMTQLVGNAWFSQELERGTHHVILIHQSGTLINLDYIDIPN